MSIISSLAVIIIIIIIINISITMMMMMMMIVRPGLRRLAVGARGRTPEIDTSEIAP